MNLQRLMRTVFKVMTAALLVLVLAACESGDESCCVGHVRGCVDELDICAWQCNEQGGDGDCYADCIDVVGECAMTCEDE